jgi:threonine/homoserine/homoserine lactone efflux protein
MVGPLTIKTKQLARSFPVGFRHKWGAKQLPVFWQKQQIGSLLALHWRLSCLQCCPILKILACLSVGLSSIFYQHEGGAEMGFFDARFAAYLAVATLLIVTPGPDTALVTRQALLAGRHAASFTTLGIGAGSFIWALASVLGIAVLLEESVVAFTVLKFVGAAYLGYLGLRSLIASFRGSKQGVVATPAPQATRLGEGVAFRQGLLNNLLNPKAGAIFATALPQFIRSGDPPLRLLLMMLAYEVVLLSWLNLYGSLVTRAGQSRFGTRIRDILQGVTGIVLIALGVRLAFERQ